MLFSEHDTLGEAWHATNEQLKTAPKVKTGKRHMQEAIEVLADDSDFRVRAVFSWGKLTSIRASRRPSGYFDSQRAVTKIDFSDPLVEFDMRKVAGHLVVTNFMSAPAHGQHIADLEDIPRDSMLELDKAVSLLVEGSNT